jgi:poly-gamma-glutamate capsule biosynthesis protein CapA/YwtB (metallophosphatase superfamily)
LKTFSLVATGDSLITMRESVYSEPEFMRLVSLIRDADVAFTNLEMNLHDYGEDCYPASESGGTYTRAPPYAIDELTWMGFDIFSNANNHSIDYMYGGLLSTISHLDKAGVPHAGTGKDLAEARAPAYLETEKARVALISACSSFPSFGRAGDARRDLKGRPGLNPLRYETRFAARQETLKKLREVEEELNLPRVYQEADSYHFLTHKFVESEEAGLHTTPHKGDMEGNLASIREAAKQADLVLISLHSHEGRPGDDERPAEFAEEFARACIDAGANCFLGHGHHAMRGIELREDKPIFYGLGNFIFQNETVQKMPADFYERYKLDPYSGNVSDAFDARQKAPPRPGYPEQKWFTEDEKYWMSVVPRMEFEGGRLKELRLYPVELGQHRPRSQRGRPMMAGAEVGERILSRIMDLSKPYGTKITIRDGMGYLEI